ncbi:MAG: hypothetical protein WBE47_04770, partial [Candidatus Acidiferrales bacterium]
SSIERHASSLIFAGQLSRCDADIVALLRCAMGGLLELQELWKARQFDKALALVDRLLSQSPECPYLLVSRGILIQLLDHGEGPPLEEAERSFLEALTFAPDNLDTLEELAHYYDSVAPNAEKAKFYAEQYLKRAEPALEKIKKILTQDV